MPPQRQFLIVDDKADSTILSEVLESSGRVHIVRTHEEATVATKRSWLGALVSTSFSNGSGRTLARDLITNQATDCLVLVTDDKTASVDPAISMLSLPGGLPILKRPLSFRDLSTFATCAVAGFWTKEERLTKLVVRYAALNDLTPREAEIVAAAMTGASRTDLADALGISENTLKGPIRVLLAKCGAPAVDVLVNHVLRGALE